MVPVRASILLFALALTSTLAANDPEATLRLRSGYAERWQDEQKSWQVVSPGEATQSTERWRTLGAEPAVFALRDDELRLAPGSAAVLDPTERTVRLDRGRIALVSPHAEAHWQLDGPWIHAEVSGSARGIALEFERSGDAERLTRLHGSVELIGPQDKKLTLADESVEEPAAAVAVHAQTDEESLTQEVLPSYQRDWLVKQLKAKPEPQGLGQLVVEDPQSGTWQRLAVARSHVNMVLQPPVALIQLDQSFYNPASQSVEGEFLFNLPEGASVSRFAMYVTDTDLMEGEIVGRKRADEIYTTIVRGRRDPAILEQLGDRLFRMRVFPIFARDTKRILLDFTIPLQPSPSGRYAFRLPLLNDLEPIWDFQLQGEIIAPLVPGSVRSWSHPNLLRKPIEGGEAFKFSGNSYRPPAEFALEFREQPQTEPAVHMHQVDPIPLPEVILDQGTVDLAAIHQAEQKRSQFFLATLPLPIDNTPPPPTDVLIVVDTSYESLHLRRLIDTTRGVVAALRPEDRFRIVCADVAARPLHDGWVQVGTAEEAKVLDDLSSQLALGVSYLDHSIHDAVEIWKDQPHQRRRILITVTSQKDIFPIHQMFTRTTDLQKALEDVGALWVGIRPAEARTQEPAETQKSGRVHGVRMAEFASRFHGLDFDLVDSQGDRAAERLVSWLRAGLPAPIQITSLTASGVASDDLFAPKSLLPGERLDVLGRREPAESLILELVTEHGSKRREHTFRLNLSKAEETHVNELSHVFLGRLWARRKLVQLESEPNTTLNNQRLILFSQEWSLLSSRTAFLVLETDADYERWNVDRAVRRPYWQPKSRSKAEPLPSTWLAEVRERTERVRRRALVDQLLAEARQALEKGEIESAWRKLHQTDALDVDRSAAAYRELSERIESQMASLEAELQLQRLTRPSLNSYDALQALLLNESFSPAFLERFPLAPKWLENVDMSDSPKSLLALRQMLTERLGVPVVLDEEALDAEGISIDESLQARAGFGRVSLRSQTRSLLRQLGLAVKEEGDHVLLTTLYETETYRLQSPQIYPVADLFTKELLPNWEMCVDPYLDRERGVRARIHDLLQKRISIGPAEQTLADFVRQIHEQTGAPVAFDLEAMDAEGLGPDTPVFSSFAPMKAEDVLKITLRPLGLTAVVHGEALMFTTMAEAETHLETRLHSGLGVVYERPVTEDEKRIRSQFNGWAGGFGFGGGMGGGMGGGGGGFGGGGFGGGGGGSFGGGFAGGGGFGGGEISAPRAPSQGDAGFGTVIEGASETANQDASETDTEVEVSDVTETEDDVEMVHDADSVLETLTSTVASDSWEMVGGPGSLRYWPYSAGFVISQTPEVHQALDRFMNQLRSVPPAFEKQLQYRPVRPGSLNPEEMGSELSYLIEVIYGNVSRDVWDTVGGPGSIRADRTRGAIIVTTTDHTHEQIWQLLAQLRRARLAALRREPGSEGSDEFLTPAGVGGPLLKSWLPQFGHREPRLQHFMVDEHLEILKVRREAMAGEYVYQIFDSNDQVTRLTIRKDASHAELATDSIVARLHNEMAHVAYPELTIRESGPWASDFWNFADGLLPWMPHRTNEQLARQFIITDVGRVVHEELGDLEILEFSSSRDQEASRLQAEFSRQLGLPVRWQLWQHDEIVLTWEFQDLQRDAVEPYWGTVIVRGKDRQPLARWQITYRPLSEPLPREADGWDRFAIYTSPDPEPSSLYRALEAMRQLRWSEATEVLDAALAQQPQQPLLILLRAVTRVRQTEADAWVHMQDQLMAVGQSGADHLLNFLVNTQEPPLPRDLVFKILQAQPEDTRDTADWQRLAVVAIELGQAQQAVEFLERSLAKQTPEPASSRQELAHHMRMLVEAKLKAGDTEGASHTAHKAWSDGQLTMDDALSMAMEMHVQKQTGRALQFLDAIDPGSLNPSDRIRLWLQQAQWLPTTERHDRWMDVIDLMPSDEAQAKLTRQLCESVQSVEEVNRLLARPLPAEAVASESESMRLSLRIRQAALTKDAALASKRYADLIRESDTSSQFRALAWQAFNRSQDWDGTIQGVERRLRFQADVSREELQSLDQAYSSRGRSVDQLRVRTSMKLRRQNW